jgi:hypothetical protein
MAQTRDKQERSEQTTDRSGFPPAEQQRESSASVLSNGSTVIVGDLESAGPPWVSEAAHERDDVLAWDESEQPPVSVASLCCCKFGRRRFVTIVTFIIPYAATSSWVLGV